MKIPKAKPETKKHRELRLNLIKRMLADGKRQLKRYGIKL